MTAKRSESPPELAHGELRSDAGDARDEHSAQTVVREATPELIDLVNREKTTDPVPASAADISSSVAIPSSGDVPIDIQTTESVPALQSAPPTAILPSPSKLAAAIPVGAPDGVPITGMRKVAGEPPSGPTSETMVGPELEEDAGIDRSVLILVAVLVLALALGIALVLH